MLSMYFYLLNTHTNINNIKYIKITFAMTNCHFNCFALRYHTCPHLLILWLCQLFLSLVSLLPSLTLYLSNSCLLCLCSLFAPTTAWTLHHSPRFSVVPPGGCSFVPPSSSPFWSGTGTAFFYSLCLSLAAPPLPPRTFLVFLPLCVK